MIQAAGVVGIALFFTLCTLANVSCAPHSLKAATKIAGGNER